MTTLFLVRHAAHDLIGRVLTGRMAGVSIGTEGRAQAGALAERLSRSGARAVYTSPLDRARQTAEPIADLLGLRPEISDAVTDVDYGEWTGLDFQTLDADPRWATWNKAKATYRPPGGETLLDVQCRAVNGVERIVAANPQSVAVVVSHGDVIKSILAHYLGLAVASIERFEISPASLSTVAIADWGATVWGLNEIAGSAEAAA